ARLGPSTTVAITRRRRFWHLNASHSRKSYFPELSTALWIGPATAWCAETVEPTGTTRPFRTEPDLVPCCPRRQVTVVRTVKFRQALVGTANFRIVQISTGPC